MIQLPIWLSNYQCKGSQVCCRRPWRAVVLPAEALRIGASLAAQDATAALGQRFNRAIATRGEVRVLKQPNGRCSLLEATGSCSLQDAAGLDGMTSACRNFPRSVVEMPRGLEVAFTPACPTVAALIVNGTGPFQWQTRDRADYPYPPRLVAPTALTVARGREMSLGELTSLRDAWWTRLGEASDWPTLRAILADLYGRPDAPSLRAPRERAPAALPALALNAELIGACTTALTALPADTRRGDRYRAEPRRIWACLSADAPGPQDLDVLPAPWVGVASRLTALGVQNAVIHDETPLIPSLRAAVRRTLLAIHLGMQLAQRFDLDSREAAQDALVASANAIR